MRIQHLMIGEFQEMKTVYVQSCAGWALWKEGRVAGDGTTPMGEDRNAKRPDR